MIKNIILKFVYIFILVFLSTNLANSENKIKVELKVGDEVDLNLLFIDHDKKRIVYKLEMLHKQDRYLASTTEVCSLYVDLNSRRVTEFEDSKKNLIKNFIEENKKNFEPGDLHLIGKIKK